MSADLVIKNGTVVTPDIPEVVRQRAGEEVLRRWQQQAARSASPADTAPPPITGP